MISLPAPPPRMLRVMADSSCIGLSRKLGIQMAWIGSSYLLSLLSLLLLTSIDYFLDLDLRFLGGTAELMVTSFYLPLSLRHCWTPLLISQAFQKKRFKHQHQGTSSTHPQNGDIFISNCSPTMSHLSNKTWTSISARPSGETRPRIGEIPTPSGTLSTWYTATFFPPLTMGMERSAGSPTAKTPRSNLQGYQGLQNCDLPQIVQLPETHVLVVKLYFSPRFGQKMFEKLQIQALR